MKELSNMQLINRLLALPQEPNKSEKMRLNENRVISELLRRLEQQGTIK